MKTIPLNIDPKLPWFEGHFPGNPILPGFAIVETSIQCLREAMGFLGSMHYTLVQAKFLQPVRPGDSYLVSLEGEGPDFLITWNKASKSESYVAQVRIRRKETTKIPSHEAIPG